jgi:hypothetical protein
MKLAMIANRRRAFSPPERAARRAGRLNFEIIPQLCDASQEQNMKTELGVTSALRWPSQYSPGSMNGVAFAGQAHDGWSRSNDGGDRTRH